MSDERITELLSIASGRELNDEEQSELDGLLEASPETERRLRSDFDRIDAILDGMPRVSPPPTLHDRIMASVSLPAARPGTRSDRDDGLYGWLNPFAALRYGVAAAAGLILAAVFYESRGIQGPLELTELVGAMAPRPERNNADVLDSFAFHAEGIECRVSLERRDGKLLLEVHVDAESPLDVAIDLASAGVRLEALAQPEEALESIEADGQVLRMRARGRRQLTALLQRADGVGEAGERMNLEFSTKGRLLKRGSLTTAW